MPSWRLLVGLAFALASSSLFFYAGIVQLRRRVLGEARVALNLFAVWWFALSAVTLGSAIFTGLASLNVLDLALWQVYTYLALGGICLALWGLLYYLLYLFTGQRGWLPILSVFYSLIYVLVLYWVQIQQPVRVIVDQWSAHIEYARPDQGPMSFAILLAIVLPQILAGLAYFTLYFRVKERAQRYRIALVSWSIVAWFSTSLVGQAFPADFRESDTWHIITRSIGLMAAGLIVMAYQPPSRIRRWLDHETAAPLEAAEAGKKPADTIRKTRPFSSLARDILMPIGDMFRPRPVGALF